MLIYWSNLLFMALQENLILIFTVNAFGIESPKSKDISGMEVKTLYEAGRIKDIAVYCSKDIYATFQLFKIWEEYLK